MRVQVGGRFTMGNNVASESRSLDENTHGQDVSNLHGVANDYSGQVNLNELISFSSSDNSSLAIGANARLLWHKASAAASFNASALNSQLQTVTTTGNLVGPSVGPTLQVIQIFARNKRYDMTVAASANDTYYCLAYYSDGTVADVTAQTAWSVNQSSGQPANSCHFSSAVPNELVINNSANETLQITAVFNGSTDACSAQVYNN